MRAKSQPCVRDWVRSDLSLHGNKGVGCLWNKPLHLLSNWISVTYNIVGLELSQVKPQRRLRRRVIPAPP